MAPSSAASRIPEDIVERLRRRAPFKAMPAADLQHLSAQLREVCYPQGSTILAPNAVPRYLHFLLEGTVQVQPPEADRSGEVLVELVEGECFPVEALEQHRASGALWRAKTDCWCLEIPLPAFREMQAGSAHFADFCRSRAERLRGATATRGAVGETTAAEEEIGLSTTLAKLMRPKPPTCRPGDSIRTALEAMDTLDSSVIVAVDGQRRPVGLFTLHDVLRRVALPQSDLEQPLEQVMTADPLVLSPESFGFEAALVMAQHGFHHIPVVAEGRLQGLVSEQELFRLKRIGLSQLRNQIRTADALAELQQLTREVRQLAHNLLVQGVAAEQLTRIISTLNDHLTIRVIELNLAAVDLGDLEFCWISLGSEGRLEQTLSTDQDNGLIFRADPGRSPEAVRQRLLPVARSINEALAACGFPLCKGGVMASNPKWCLSEDEWRQQFTSWLDRPEPDSLLNATIFFDLRPLYGDLALGRELGSWLQETAPRKEMFLHYLAANALGRTPPIGFFRDFVVENRGEHANTVDLKRNGVAPFVDAARVMGLQHGAGSPGTAQRLRCAAAPMHIAATDAEAWIDAFYFIQMLRLRHQYALERDGATAHNHIDPYQLNDLDRKFFLESLRQAKKLQRKLAAEYKVGSMGM